MRLGSRVQDFAGNITLLDGAKSKNRHWHSLSASHDVAFTQYFFHSCTNFSNINLSFYDGEGGGFGALDAVLRPEQGYKKGQLGPSDGAKRGDAVRTVKLGRLFSFACSSRQEDVQQAL